ncbi:Zn-ribbon domain-containing OB-fold protein [Blastococcus deserti]|uniref:Zn-ribbon domain-containing OB-fold protein n=1 Tax=Blastococcus deserti TaxID=2259033 RepID=A0ABW4X5R6_9ACTN
MADPAATEDVGPTRRYLEALREGRLVYQRCGQCTAAVFPPRVLCSVCSADALDWQPSEGAGTVYSASTLTPRDEDPYTVVLVDLDEGFRVMSAVAGTSAPLGSRVQLVPQPADDPAGEPRLVAVLEGAG